MGELGGAIVYKYFGVDLSLTSLTTISFMGELHSSRD